MSYAIKVTINGKRVFAGNHGLPSVYKTKNKAKNDVDKYLTGKVINPRVIKLTPKNSPKKYLEYK